MPIRWAKKICTPNFHGSLHPSCIVITCLDQIVRRLRKCVCEKRALHRTSLARAQTIIRTTAFDARGDDVSMSSSKPPARRSSHGEKRTICRRLASSWGNAPLAMSFMAQLGENARRSVKMKSLFSLSTYSYSRLRINSNCQRLIPFWMLNASLKRNMTLYRNKSISFITQSFH